MLLLLHAFTPTTQELLRLFAAFGVIVGIALLFGALSAVIDWIAERDYRRIKTVVDEQAERRHFQALMASRETR